MTRDDVLEDDELRLVDVLLEEELGAERRAVVPAVVAVRRRARRGRWLAAALVLLGVGVFAGATLLQRAERERSVAPAQDPQPAPVPPGAPFVPKDETELAAFLRGVTRVEVAALDSFRPSPNGEPSRVRGGEAAADDPASLAAARAAWTENPEPAGVHVRAEATFVGADGRRLAVQFGDPNRLLAGACFWQPPAETARLLRRLADEAEANARATDVRADDVVALRAAPDTTRWLYCRVFDSAALQQELPRLQRLESLSVPAVDDRFGTVLAALPRLQHLSLAGGMLTEAGWLRIARAARPRSLTVFGAAPGITADVTAAFAPRLESLRLVGDEHVPFPWTETVLPALGSLRELRELQLAIDPVHHGPWDRSSIGRVLALPHLRRLALAVPKHTEGRDEFAIFWPALRGARIERLVLNGGGLDLAAIDALAAMPELRSLALHGVAASADSWPKLAALSRLERLDLNGNGLAATVLADVRRALPECAVIGMPGTVYGRFVPFGFEDFTHDTHR